MTENCAKIELRLAAYARPLLAKCRLGKRKTSNDSAVHSLAFKNHQGWFSPAPARPLA